MHEKEIRLRNIYPTAFVISKLKVEPELFKIGETVYFSFPKTKEITHCLLDFDSGGQVPACEYAEALKELRARMYAVKKSEKENGNNGQYKL